MPQSIIVNGKQRFLGFRPTSPQTIARMHRHGRIAFSHEHAPLVRAARPLADWQESDCAHFWKHRKDQNGYSMCVGFSGSHAIDLCFAKEGFDVNTSPAAAYAPICGGSDNGASMGECLDALQQYGVFLSGSDGIDDLDWKSAYRSKFWTNPGGALGKEARAHRIVEAVFCSSLDDFLQGLQSGLWSGQFGMGVGRNFEPDANGWMPKCDGAGINHALCALGGMAKHPSTGNWGIQGGNSWGDWGPLNGVFWCEAEDWLDRDGQELWLVRSTTFPSGIAAQ